ncbi:hypothetical protein CDV31_017164, partial [Fusarium ambrosium]
MGAGQSIPLVDPPSDPQSLGTDFFNYLAQFQHYHNAPYVHPRAISFKDAAHRANWKGYITDAKDRDTIAEFYNAPKHNKHCWLGFFSVESDNWVGKKSD